MTETETRKLITAKEAEAFVPTLKCMIGNYKIREHFQRCLARPAESDANVLIEGEPGTGKSIAEIAYLRERLTNPDLYGDDIAKTLEEHRRWIANPQLNEYDVRRWQCKVPGKIYALVRINGATDNKNTLEHKIADALYNFEGQDHTLVLLDEAGELYFKGLEETLRPLLTDPNVTTYANAQNFHSKRRTDSRKEEEDRLRAFHRRFTHRFYTENPTSEELIKFLVRRMREWGIKLDEPATLRLLIEKSNGVVGYALRPLIKAIDEQDRWLTQDIVERYDVDPLHS